MIAKKGLLAPLGLFLAAFLLRLALIGKGFYHTDCLTLGIQAQKILDTHHMHYLHLTGYPLTAVLGAIFLGAGHLLGVDNPAFSVNFMSVVFGSLSVVLFYLLVKELLDETTALLSAGLVLVHPIVLANSVYGNSHMPSLFFFLLTSLILLRYRRRPSLASLVPGAVSAGLMAAARPQNMVLFVPLTYLFFMKSLPVPESRGLPARRKDFPLFLALSVLTFASFYAPLAAGLLARGRPMAALKTSVAQSLIWEALRDLDPYATWISLLAVLKSFSVPGIVLIGAGLPLLFKKSRRLFFLILLWAALPLLSFGSLVTAVPRFYINIVIPLSVGAGYALSAARRRRRFLFLAGCLLYYAAIILPFSRIYPVLNFRHHHDLMGDYAAWIRDHTGPRALIFAQDARVIIENCSPRETAKPPFLKYASRTYTKADEKELEDVRALIAKKLHEGIPVYATYVALFSHDPELRFLDMLERNFRIRYVARTVMEEWHQGELSLTLYHEYLYKIESK